MDRRVIEGIEACRPSSGDLQQNDLADVARAVEHDPEAQAQYLRVQAWDAAIAGAMEHLSVPPGLADRILDRLQSAGSAPTSPPTGGTAEVVLIDRAVETAGLNLRWRRRQWLGVAAGVAATLLVAVLLSDRLTPRSSEDSLDVMADRWMAELAAQPGAWQKMSAAPADFAVPSVITASAVGWRTVTGVRGVAYQLRNNVGRATLFVIKHSPAGLPWAPPFDPQSTTGGRSVGYWQSGPLVYVLVVEGNEGSYRQFVSTSRAPFA